MYPCPSLFFLLTNYLRNFVDVPAVHTRITEYLEWIEKIIGKDQRLGSMPNAGIIFVIVLSVGAD